MDWMACNHSLFVYVPAAVAILLPWALVSAQRAGRGIRPWWLTCRYLAWCGLLFSLVALFSGFLQAQHQNLLAPGQFLAPKGGLRLHQILGASSLLLGALTLKTLFRRREEHQGLGFLALFTGLAWVAVSLGAMWYGRQLGQPRVASEPLPVKAVQPTVPALLAAPGEAQVPTRALDYLSLVPMHEEPVRSALHGNRWIRVWANPAAVEAYRAGQRLPEGAFLVMNSQEDRWGRPGIEAGPLYSMEMKGGKAHFTYYWARVPEAKRGETGGADRAYWHGEDSHLGSCLTCHADGLAPKKDRSTWVVPRRPKPQAPSGN